MASIALNSFAPALRSTPLLNLTRVWQNSVTRYAALTTPAIPILALPSIQSLWDLFPGFLRAVPKKKVSHSRKAMRSANKGLEDKNNIVACPACGGPKLAHHLCPECYSSLSRSWKAANKEIVEVEMGADSKQAS